METTKEFDGILPLPTGSEVHRLSTEADKPINNGNIADLCSERGMYWIEKINENSLDAGTTIGSASTFRVTDQRGVHGDIQDKIELDRQFRQWNEKLVRNARKAYGNLPLLGNIAPITNTSKSSDDETFTRIGGGSAEAQIDYCYRRHLAQIRILAREGVDGILVEAGRHVEDILGAARATREALVHTFCASFEIDDEGIPGGYSLEQIRVLIQREMENDADVLVGANCVGPIKMNELLQNGERIGIGYPNQRDSQLFLPLQEHEVKNLSTAANELEDAALISLVTEISTNHPNLYIPNDRAELVRWLNKTGETSIENLQEIWGKLLRQRARIIGICCGGRPEHVQAAAEVWKSSKKQALVKT